MTADQARQPGMPWPLYQRGEDGYPVGADETMKQAYGPIPEAAEFRHGTTGRPAPAQIHGWQWSTDFGRWSALVTFEDGWHGFTYPVPERIVLASVDPPSVWNYYPSREAARAAQEEANAYNVRLEAHGAPKRVYEPMTLDAYLQAERAYYLDRPEEEITRERFIEMLEVLPPESWERHGSWETFILSEHQRGSYAEQFIRRGRGDEARFFSKIVDAEDRETWMRG